MQHNKRVAFWNNLLGPYAEELIDQAYKDAAAGLHKMSKVTVSNVLCICGCDTYLPSTLADRGWKYHHGHKPKVHNGTSAISNTNGHVHDKPKLAQPTIANLPVIENYFQSALKLVQEQIEAKTKAKLELEKAIEQLMTQGEKLIACTKAVGALHD
jgi:hypothetical protein